LRIFYEIFRQKLISQNCGNTRRQPFVHGILGVALKAGGKFSNAAKEFSEALPLDLKGTRPLRSLQK